MLPCVVMFFLVRLSVSLPLSRSRAFSPSVSDSSPLLDFGDQVRRRHLYMENKHSSLFVEVLSNGTVSITPTLTSYTLLELKAVKPGYTAIRGVMSSLYLCVNADGHLFALGVFLDTDCSFREMVQPDGYTHFLSAQHTRPVSVSVSGAADEYTRTFSQFLPLRTQNQHMEKSEPQEALSLPTDADWDSDDPFRLMDTHRDTHCNTHHDLMSPLFHISR